MAIDRSRTHLPRGDALAECGGRGLGANRPRPPADPPRRCTALRSRPPRTYDEDDVRRRRTTRLREDARADSAESALFDVPVSRDAPPTAALAGAASALPFSINLCLFIRVLESYGPERAVRGGAGGAPRRRDTSRPNL